MVKSFSPVKNLPIDEFEVFEGIGMFTPGIFRFGYAGGGPYFCIV